MTAGVTTLAGPSGARYAGAGEREPPNACTHENTRRFTRSCRYGGVVTIVACVDCGRLLGEIGGGER